MPKIDLYRKSYALDQEKYAGVTDQCFRDNFSTPYQPPSSSPLKKSRREKSGQTFFHFTL